MPSLPFAMNLKLKMNEMSGSSVDDFVRRGYWTIKLNDDFAVDNVLDTIERISCGVANVNVTLTQEGPGSDSTRLTHSQAVR